MPGFDAERYLRLLGEETLRGGVEDRHGLSSPLKDSATALVAVGAISPAHGREVLSDYSAAQAARDGRADFLFSRMARQTPASPPTRPAIGRIVAVGDEIRLPTGILRLRHVTFDDDRTEVSATFNASPGADRTRDS